MKNTGRIFRGMVLTVVCLAVVLPPRVLCSQETDPARLAAAAMPAPIEVKKEAVAFAQTALAKYIKNVITRKNAARFGFKSADEAQIANVGAPYAVTVIGLERLQKYEPTTDVKRMWVNPKKLWFPVIVQGQTRTKMEILLKEDKFIAGEFGGIRSVEEVARATRELPRLIEARRIEKVKQVALIKIPVLNATFLFVESESQQFLVPAMTKPQKYNLERSTMYIADEVLSALKVIAQKIDGEKLM